MKTKVPLDNSTKERVDIKKLSPAGMQVVFAGGETGASDSDSMPILSTAALTSWRATEGVNLRGISVRKYFRLKNR
jgi:hypothetical protein